MKRDKREKVHRKKKAVAYNVRKKMTWAIMLARKKKHIILGER